MLRNLHLHYMAWRREALEAELAKLRAEVKTATGMRAEQLYVLIACTVNQINPLRLAQGMGYISAYADTQ